MVDAVAGPLCLTAGSGESLDTHGLPKRELVHPAVRPQCVFKTSRWALGRTAIARQDIASLGESRGFLRHRATRGISHRDRFPPTLYRLRCSHACFRPPSLAPVPPPHPFPPCPSAHAAKAAHRPPCDFSSRLLRSWRALPRRCEPSRCLYTTGDAPRRADAGQGPRWRRLWRPRALVADVCGGWPLRPRSLRRAPPPRHARRPEVRAAWTALAPCPGAVDPLESPGSGLRGHYLVVSAA